MKFEHVNEEVHVSAGMCGEVERVARLLQHWRDVGDARVRCMWSGVECEDTSDVLGVGCVGFDYVRASKHAWPHAPSH